MALSTGPNITGPILEYSMYHYNSLPSTAAADNMVYEWGGVTCILTVGRSVTTVKARVKGQGYKFVLSQWSRSLFWSMVNDTLYFHNQFWGAIYANIWHYTKLYVAYNFGRDLKDSCNHIIGVLIVFNIVSLATIPITHQEIIKQCKYVLQKTANTWTNKWWSKLLKEHWSQRSIIQRGLKS